ncbi:hypothetical protein SeLEV6574_g03334 [Synchytrium endobioticum]|nr:hypothetical protein SeLEV6574_g03334 [Synchytrium endobioticum]
MSTLEDLIVAATLETNTSENWSAIIQICERADRNEASARDAVAVLRKRVQHKNVNVVLFSLTIANSLVQNCGTSVRREICSRAFVDALVKLVSNRSIHETIRARILDMIQNWADAFKNEPTLGFMVDTYNLLKQQNYQFPSMQKPPPQEKTRSQMEKEKEEEEYQLALALSMSATEKEEISKSSQSRQIKPQVEFFVRALYDFRGHEEGELGMNRGDIVAVYDSVTFREWWKGTLKDRVGIFPSNYVEKVAGPVDENSVSASNGGTGASHSTVELQVMSQAYRLDEFTSVLAAVDPKRDSISENEKLQESYNAVLSLRPKIVKAMEASKVKRDELGLITDRFVRAIQTYHHLMELASRQAAQQRATYAVPPQQQHYYQPPQPSQSQHPHHAYYSQ